LSEISHSAGDYRNETAVISVKFRGSGETRQKKSVREDWTDWVRDS